MTNPTISERTSLLTDYLSDTTLGINEQKDLLLDRSQTKVSKSTRRKLSMENWKMSYMKWNWLVLLARLRIRFHSKNGFSFLKVVGKCGYCIEFESNCLNCNLYKQNLCCSVQNLTKEKRKSVALWKYLRVMQKGVKNYNVNINWKQDVLAYAIKMRDAIKKDKPKTSSTLTPLQIFSQKAA